MRPHPFLENVVILTGASCGIGRALALQLAWQFLVDVYAEVAPPNS